MNFCCCCWHSFCHFLKGPLYFLSWCLNNIAADFWKVLSKFVFSNSFDVTPPKLFWGFWVNSFSLFMSVFSRVASSWKHITFINLNSFPCTIQLAYPMLAIFYFVPSILFQLLSKHLPNKGAKFVFLIIPKKCWKYSASNGIRLLHSTMSQISIMKCACLIIFGTWTPIFLS